MPKARLFWPLILKRQNIIAPVVLFVFTVLTVISKLKFHGLQNGMDFGIYQPDGALYTMRTLLFLGHDQTEAANQISQWYATNAYKRNDIDPSALIPANNPVWGLVAPRPLYPLLSVPFVWLIGIPGMLVIPIAMVKY